MALKLKTAPAVEPISATEAKLHCRVDHTTDDTLITNLITAARIYCEKQQNRALVTQTWYLWLDKFPSKKYIDIPLPPLQSVASVLYYDTDDAEYTLSTEDYDVDINSFVGRVHLKYSKSWPTEVLRPSNAIVIEFICGYGLAAAVPQNVKQAMLLLIGHWYANRESVLVGSVSKPLEMAVDNLLGFERVW
jgi:uncharacterized phiE125 gp8 family phage protein